ncbi:hypothetical protein TRM7615_02576 [Falsiruegeria mediterranea M17]|uniref:D-glucuronyl C5-epimerase C-terminal domain-containing protein n=2 Tax=Falsiruegeria TaxID=2854184 RepID=A0A2R8C9E6_9RHOB|nr:hypothetical protein TRM7615_02576 [Falsiruegeria mediterranea M17]
MVRKVVRPALHFCRHYTQHVLVHMVYYARLLKGGERWRPIRPKNAQMHSIAPDLPEILLVDYDLLTTPVVGQHPVLSPPEGWHPQTSLSLEEALPFPWSKTYTDEYGQLFQPVVFWRNAIALDEYLKSEQDPARQLAALTLANLLLERLRAFTVRDGDAAFIENRFALNSTSPALDAPWVSAISNAFAILGCLRLSKHLAVDEDLLMYGRAFQGIHTQGGVAPGRWISFRDRAGYLWFDEYPLPNGRATRVQNGHIFAVLALHELSLNFPGRDFGTLTRAGATTIEATVACFRRPGTYSRYALGRWFEGDYLPGRAIRQLYQLYELTGAQRFLSYGDLLLKDTRSDLSQTYLDTVTFARKAALRRRPQSVSE